MSKKDLVSISLPRASRNFSDVKARNDFFFYNCVWCVIYKKPSKIFFILILLWQNLWRFRPKTLLFSPLALFYRSFSWTQKQFFVDIESLKSVSDWSQMQTCKEVPSQYQFWLKECYDEDYLGHIIGIWYTSVTLKSFSRYAIKY